MRLVLLFCCPDLLPSGDPASLDIKASKVSLGNGVIKQQSAAHADHSRALFSSFTQPSALPESQPSRHKLHKNTTSSHTVSTMHSQPLQPNPSSKTLPFLAAAASKICLCSACTGLHPPPSPCCPARRVCVRGRKN